MKTSTKLALISLLWIAAINTGLINADANLRLQMAHAWSRGTEEVAPDYRPESRAAYFSVVNGAGGRRYVPFDLGQSMLMLPGDWLGTQLHRWFPKVGERDFRGLVVSVAIFVPLNVAAVVSCFWLLRVFEFSEQIAGLTSITWLLGTTVLHYAQVPQQNNQLLLFTTIGYAAALTCVKRGNPRFAMLSGLVLSAAFLIRFTSLIHVLTVFLFLAGCMAYQSRYKLKFLKVLGYFIVGFMPLALLERVFTYIRYGSFWTSGQSFAIKQLYADPMWSNLAEIAANYPFNNPPHVGILGVLFSAAKSIFIYDPLLLPCLGLGIILWKRLSPYIQWYLVCGIFNLCGHIVVTSKLDFWDGGAAWAARYHVTSVHLLLIPVLAIFLGHLLSVKGLTVWLMRLLITVAIFVQIASVILVFSLESAQDLFVAPESRHLQFHLGQRVTNIVCQINSYLSNSSFAERCVSGDISKLPQSQRYFLKYRHQIAFLPFNYVRFGFNRKWAFIVWGALLTLAIATTLWFCFLAQGKTTSFIH